MITKGSPDKLKALEKAKHYCSYQERSHEETRQKLLSMGLRRNETEEILSELIAQDYLNEERYATQFAGGRFRLKKWGRNKITHALRLQHVSEYCIKKALSQIPESDYENMLWKLATEKWQSHRSEKNLFAKLRKTQDYLLQKGYEREQIFPILQKLQTGS